MRDGLGADAGRPVRGEIRAPPAPSLPEEVGRCLRVVRASDGIHAAVGMSRDLELGETLAEQNPGDVAV